MRNVLTAFVMTALTIIGTAADLWSCCCDPSIFMAPLPIKFPGVAEHGIVRNNHFITVNEEGRLFVVKLQYNLACDKTSLGQQVFDLGPVGNIRLANSDVADGRVLLMTADHLIVRDLASGKTLHTIPTPKPLFAAGFVASDQVFAHLGDKVVLIELATGKTLRTIELTKEPKEKWVRYPGESWQKFGDRIFVVGPNRTIYAIHPNTGTVRDSYQIDARTGIADFRVWGNQIFCFGSQSTWAVTDYLVCFNMSTQKTTTCELSSFARRGNCLASCPIDGVYMVNGKQIDHFDRTGQRVGTYKPEKPLAMVGVWQNYVLLADKDVIRFQEIRETPVAKK